jgi:outer membrane protein assembly factor BamE
MARGTLLKQLQYAYACGRGFQPDLMQILTFFCFTQWIFSQEILPNLPDRLLLPFFRHAAYGVIRILTGTAVNIIRIRPPQYLSPALRHDDDRLTLNSILRKTCIYAALACLISFSSACVYELDVQQGNKLEPQDVQSVEVGMTRNQVRFLLGTPVVNDVFHEDRWDYIYYFRAGRSKKPERRWLIVWFDENIVKEIQRDVVAQPG